MVLAPWAMEVREFLAIIHLLKASQKAFDLLNDKLDLYLDEIQRSNLRRIWAHEISFFVRNPELG